MILSGNADIAALPSNVAANLFQVTQGDILMVAIPNFGTLYLLENGETIQSWADLRGKTIYATGQGANPEFILRHLLEANGLTPGVDVQIQFLTEHAELATLMAEGLVDIGMLPEPNVTAARLQNSDLRIALDFTAEWKQVTDGALTMTAVVARREFIEAHPQAIDNFLFDLKTSINFVLNDPAAAAELCAEFGIIPNPVLALHAIPQLNLTMITGTAMQPVLEPYLRILYAANPQAIGGALPDETFYYIPQVIIE
jgi:NitT/TauT family transport system substrate-binding protein